MQCADILRFSPSDQMRRRLGGRGGQVEGGSGWSGNTEIMLQIIIGGDWANDHILNLGFDYNFNVETRNLESQSQSECNNIIMK